MTKEIQETQRGDRRDDHEVARRWHAWCGRSPDSTRIAKTAQRPRAVRASAPTCCCRTSTCPTLTVTLVRTPERRPRAVRILLMPTPPSRPRFVPSSAAISTATIEKPWNHNELVTTARKRRAHSTTQSHRRCGGGGGDCGRRATRSMRIPGHTHRAQRPRFVLDDRARALLKVPGTPLHTLMRAAEERAESAASVLLVRSLFGSAARAAPSVRFVAQIRPWCTAPHFTKAIPMPRRIAAGLVDAAVELRVSRRGALAAAGAGPLVGMRSATSSPPRRPTQ